jgi:hypothetical protein
MPGCQFHFHGYYAASTSPAAITHSAMRKLYAIVLTQLKFARD